MRCRSSVRPPAPCQLGASSAHFASPVVSKCGRRTHAECIACWHGVVSEREGALYALSVPLIVVCYLYVIFSPPTSQAHALLNANGHI